MNPEVDAAMAEAQEGRAFEQGYVSPAEALKALDKRVLVVCDRCRHIVEQLDDAPPEGEFVTPCPKCGGETGTYSPRCDTEGCSGFAFALMPGIGSKCKRCWRRLKREAEEPKRPGARGRKHGSNKKKRRKGRR